MARALGSEVWAGRAALAVLSTAGIAHALHLPTLIGVSSVALAGGVAAGLAARRRPARTDEQDAPDDAITKSARGPSAGEHEKLLRAVVDNAPMAVLVYGETGKVAYSNGEARALFFEGKPLDGENFLRLIEFAPDALRQCLVRERDALFTVEQQGELDTYSLAHRSLELAGEVHTLLMVKQLTPELGRQEIDVWKKVIRIINHELNNSLAPISSMVHSARLIAKSPERLDRLERVFDTIDERTRHLTTFLEGYARFARLPRPRPEPVALAPFLEGLRALYPGIGVGPSSAADGFFDPGQVQQALINLLKNAIEASGGEQNVELGVESTGDGTTVLSVRDRGPGMSDEVLQSALIPFFSTKEKGTGLGLALCREIVEAHHGKLRLSRRAGGGLEVSCWLPGRGTQLPPRTGRLTLTRG